MPRDLPTGTVTFLFTDVEGSTRLLHELGASEYAETLAEHRRVLRDAFTRHGGVEVDTQGDAFFVAFPTPQGAIAASREAQATLGEGPVRVRMGIHTGTPHLTGEGYVGADVHRAARLAAVGHGGQVLVSAATVGITGRDGLRDLGDHRLKDLSAPERIYQLGEAAFPPLATLHQTNLPVPATVFLGREKEVADVAELLRRDDVRSITLTGPGGTGKTRLALQAAGAVGDAFPGGVWWVPLAPIRDPELVLPAAAKALGAPGDLAEHIADTQLLLLFDNFEHVTAAAVDLGELLGRCPRLKVVVTSREALRIVGEWEYAVDPLRDPEADELFTTRALAARRDFTGDGEVREICRRLDNLPLAIELAAARVKVLSPGALLERLEQRLPVLTGGARDAPERQRTLRATIEWSHDLLAPDEQRLFARLSVFRGGCTLQAAEAVADADLDTLGSLVDKSLLRQRDDRFWMLETIREYAAERLDASGEADDIRRRHARFFLALAEEAEPHLRGSPRAWLDRLESEHDNFRAAFDRLLSYGEGESTLRLCGALWRFWAMRGHFGEGSRRTEAILSTSDEPTAARAAALNGASALAVHTGSIGVAMQHAEEALAIHRRLGDRWATANSTFLLGMVHTEREEWEIARQLFEESLAVFEALEDSHYVLLVTRNLAWMYYELGEYEQGHRMLEENVRRARAVGNKRMESASLHGLAWRVVDAGRAEDAFALLERSFELDRELGALPGIEQDVFRLARALHAMGQFLPAAVVMARAVALAEQMGSQSEWRERERLVGALRRELGEQAFAEASARGRDMTDDDAVKLALSAARSSASRPK